MLKFNAKNKVSPQRRAAEELLANLKPTLEMEAGRGSITVSHYLQCRHSENEEDLYPSQQQGTGFYAIESVVATGGMGAILRAFDNNLQRTVALKVMLNSAEASESTIYSFVAEAQITGQLEHPNIIPLHDMGVAVDGTIYYTMKLISGRTLREILKEIRDGNDDTIQRYPLDRLLTVFQKVCDGIAYAHARNVVHRDLKPDNVMVGEFGEVLILDWGLAKVLTTEGAAVDAATSEGEEFEGGLPGGDSFATLAGQVKGTPNYMAPEQAEGRVEDIDNRTDVYALGGILHAVLTLHPPITGSNLDEILTKVTGSQITPPLSYNSAEVQNPTGLPAPHCPEGRIPSALSAVAMKCMSYDSDERYMFVEALQGDIAAYQGGYATGAEHAGLFTQLKLLIQRNKKEVFFILLIIAGIVATAASFLTKVQLSALEAKKQTEIAQGKIEELRKSAPAFMDAAINRIIARDFDIAETNITYAIDLDPEVADFYNVLGNVHMARLEIQKAIDNFNKAESLDPNHPHAQGNREICNQIKSGIESGSESNSEAYRDALRLLNTYLIDQKRNAEAFNISEKLGTSDDQLLDDYNKRLWRGRLPENAIIRTNSEFWADLSGLTNASIVGMKGVPLTRLNLAGASEVSDITPLDQMPLRELNLSGTLVDDLATIRSLNSLTKLDLSGCKELADLGSLQGMTNIKWLDISGSAVESLEALAGMNLEYINVSFTGVRDLSPLEDMTALQEFLAENSKVINITPLKNAALRVFKASGTRLKSIDALRGDNHSLEIVEIARSSVTSLAPLADKGRLHRVDLYKTRISDVSALAGKKLTWLDMREMPVSDISALGGMPLQTLRLADTKISSISAIDNAPLEIELDLTNTKISDIQPLKSTRLKKVSLAQTRVQNLEPLKELPLVELRLDGLTGVTQPDLNPIWHCRATLKRLSLTFPSLTAIKLKEIKTIERITYNVSYKQDPDVKYRQSIVDWDTALTYDQFWKDFHRRNPNVDR
ncbi:MAG: hypothetical protein CMO80_14340 [Verrucomicrobiales bacterium]|nr:hypothetical protein [Verrucomicrobiales bacterium]